MSREIIKITEGDLRNIIRESVNRIISEVMFRGKSYHGTNGDDWEELSDIRADASKYYDKEFNDGINTLPKSKTDSKKWADDRIASHNKKWHNYDQSSRDMLNAMDVCDDDTFERRKNKLLNR